jgi:hypothetical protein
MNYFEALTASKRLGINSSFSISMGGIEFFFERVFESTSEI